jgi:hypothetical protein
LFGVERMWQAHGRNDANDPNRTTQPDVLDTQTNRNSSPSGEMESGPRQGQTRPDYPFISGLQNHVATIPAIKQNGDATKPSTIVASAPISLPPPEIRYRAKHMPPSMRPKVATPTMTPKRLAVFASLLVGSAKLLVSSVVLIVAFHNSLSTALFSRYAFAIRRHPRSIRQTCEKPKGNATYGNDCMPTSMPMRKCVDHCRASIEASTKHLIWEYLVSGNRHLHSAN